MESLKKRTLFLFSLFISFLYGIAIAQTELKGKIVDKATGEPLPFVNIGLWGKDMGTVSDEKGAFILRVTQANPKDTVRVSCIGYAPLLFHYSEFQTHLQKKAIIEMVEKETTLPTVVVKPKKTKKVGNTTDSQSMQAGFASNDLGAELGVLIKAPKKPFRIDEFSFNISHCQYDSLFFRLNVYTFQKGFPKENILKENVFVKQKGGNGRFNIDLRPYNLHSETDVIIALEWIKDLNKVYGVEKGLFFSATLFGTSCYFRKTSQGGWKRSPVPMGFYATITY